mmetsp:Transcript_32853/g.79971  ORF Transcript_32853/g.79971 Transcript_32853/m.79971 type:complete len:312 (-) Transcript_32853:377-1312(-)
MQSAASPPWELNHNVQTKPLMIVRAVVGVQSETNSVALQNAEPRHGPNALVDSMEGSLGLLFKHLSRFIDKLHVGSQLRHRQRLEKMRSGKVQSLWRGKLAVCPQLAPNLLQADDIDPLHGGLHQSQAGPEEVVVPHVEAHYPQRVLRGPQVRLSCGARLEIAVMRDQETALIRVRALDDADPMGARAAIRLGYIGGCPRVPDGLRALDSELLVGLILDVNCSAVRSEDRGIERDDSPDKVVLLVILGDVALILCGIGWRRAATRLRFLAEIHRTRPVVASRARWRWFLIVIVRSDVGRLGLGSLGRVGTL